MSHATDKVATGDVITLDDGRKVQVQGTPFLTVIKDNRGRIAVRNIETHRLSYIPEWRLLITIARIKQGYES